MLWLAALLLLIPKWSGGWLVVDAFGLALGVAVVAWEWSRSPVRPLPVAPADNRGASDVEGIS